MTRTVGIFLYDEVEVLDFSGPYEVFLTASRVKTRLEQDSVKPFNVFTLASSKEPVIARGGLRILPDYTLIDHPKLDLVIIPGGVITTVLENHGSY